MRLHANDNVIITKGRDKGKQGNITRVLNKQNKVVVEGINIVTKHQKPTGAFQQGGLIQKEMPIPAANVSLVCVHCSKPTRVAYRYLGDNTKARVCAKCEEVIE
ncbi:MAG: 50S ribosomal protein L24 [SAR202 cluster bacterium]|jgi:large subunit ribosomal protein L24|nr:50S ribosomal protein L24 [SAR202 cluster bacterium]MDP6513100.1 50S ribosomal protein L24 [SAR202 cluster bacterium]MDP6715119.1 50S ribosomal protein L24 [SAR202 cluster bacterium]